jgi:glucose-1-phosphate adenylyltransferase
MDLLGTHPVLNRTGDDWRIFARHNASAPQFVGARATVENSYVTEGCEIYGTVKNSVIGPGAKVMYGAVVEDCVLMGDCVIEAGATVKYAIIDTDVTVGANATVGADRASGAEIAVIGEGVSIAAGATVEPGAMLSE